MNLVPVCAIYSRDVFISILTSLIWDVPILARRLGNNEKKEPLQTNITVNQVNPTLPAKPLALLLRRHRHLTPELF